jgi:hypothetical protein
MFKREFGDWVKYRSSLNLSRDDEVDLHLGRRDRSISYEEAMGENDGIVEGSLREAQRVGRLYVVFRHGSSTSRPGKTTARSQVRKFMRSKLATPLIERRDCIRHPTVFVAKVRLTPQK